MSHILGPFIGPFIDWVISLLVGVFSLASHIILSALRTAIETYLDLTLFWQTIIYLFGVVGIGVDAPSNEDEDTSVGDQLVSRVQNIESNGIDGTDWDAVIEKTIAVLVVYPFVGWWKVFCAIWGVLWNGTSTIWNKLVESDWVSLSIFSGDVVSISLTQILSKILRR